MNTNTYSRGRMPLAGSLSCFVQHPFDTAARNECNRAKDVATVEAGGNSNSNDIWASVGDFASGLISGWFGFMPRNNPQPQKPDYTPWIVGGGVALVGVYLLTRKK